MDFWAEVIITVLKMIFIGGVAFGGIILGKNLRIRKNKKQEAQKQAE